MANRRESFGCEKRGARVSKLASLAFIAIAGTLLPCAAGARFSRIPAV
jgi:hypothetical protein